MKQMLKLPQVKVELLTPALEEVTSINMATQALLVLNWLRKFMVDENVSLEESTEKVSLPQPWRWETNSSALSTAPHYPPYPSTFALFSSPSLSTDLPHLSHPSQFHTHRSLLFHSFAFLLFLPYCPSSCFLPPLCPGCRLPAVDYLSSFAWSPGRVRCRRRSLPLWWAGPLPPPSPAPSPPVAAPTASTDSR